MSRRTRTKRETSAKLSTRFMPAPASGPRGLDGPEPREVAYRARCAGQGLEARRGLVLVAGPQLGLRQVQLRFLGVAQAALRDALFHHLQAPFVAADAHQRL